MYTHILIIYLPWPESGHEYYPKGICETPYLRFFQSIWNMIGYTELQLSYSWDPALSFVFLFDPEYATQITKESFIYCLYEARTLSSSNETTQK